MINSIKEWDEYLFLKLNSFNAEWLDPAMFIISAKYTWIPVYVFLLWYIWKKTNTTTTLFFLLAVIIGITLADQISVHLFKNIFQRYRPTHNENFGHLVHVVRDFNGNEYRGGMFGFVSSHAANFGMLATLVTLRLKRYNPYFKTLPVFVFIFVAYSRIYLGVHYPGDVIVGGILGFTIGLIMYLILNYLENYFALKKSINHG